ncbi:MAG: TonB-dependent receptor [Vicinamibacterales bacterium]
MSIGCLFVAMATQAGAQTNAVSGTVVDSQRAAVVSAEVVLTRTPGGAARVVMTDGSGRYSIVDVEPGVYQIEVRANGFRVAREAVRVQTGQSSTQDFTLAISSFTDVVSVTGTTEGSAQGGYRAVSTAAAGPSGQVPLRDLPYSVNVVPSELIRNQQSFSTDDIFRTNPLVQATGYTGRNTQSFVNVRGFNVTNKALDGMKSANFQEDAVEDKERVEVLSGLSGFLYGPASPGGMVNYALKRPTSTRVNSVTVGGPYGRSGYAHVDLGGPIGSGKLGYRVNVAGQGGSTAIDEQKQNRVLASGAFDWHLSDAVLLQIDGSHFYKKIEGVPPSLGFGGAGAPYPSPALANDKLWSQPWTFTKSTLDQGGLRFNWALNDTLLLRSALEVSRSEVDFTTFQTQAIALNGNYAPFVGGEQYPISHVISAFTYLDTRLTTGRIQHQATVGFSSTSLGLDTNVAFTQNCLSPSGTIGFANCTPAATSPFNIASPQYIPIPTNFFTANTAPGQTYRSSTTSNVNVVLADTMTLSRQWSVLVGVNRANLEVKNFTVAGADAGTFDKGAWTPSVSVLFKPVPLASTYVSYIEGLEQGQIVTGNFTNAGTVLPPLRSKQYEVGAKVDVGRVLVTGAFFRIDKPNQFSDLATPVPTFVQDGRQVHQGVELTATGRVSDSLSLVTGLTSFSPEVQRANNPALIGKRPQGVAKTVAKAYLEYTLPMLRSVIVTGGVNGTSNFAIDATNTAFLPGVALLDLGARYQTTIGGRALVLRFSAANALGKDYWLGPGTLGIPRTISISATTAF